MKNYFLFCLPLFLLSCKTPMELDHLSGNEIPFEALVLEPDYDLIGIRIDLVRQTETTYAADSTMTSMEEDAPYHPLGFRLGNGLFYDLRANLGLDPHALWGLSMQDDLSLRRTSKLKKRNNSYEIQMNGEEVCFEQERASGRLKKRCQEIQFSGDTILRSKNGRHLYRIVRQEDALQFTSRKKAKHWTEVRLRSENFYESKRKNKTLDYQQKGDSIELSSRFLLKPAEEGKTMEIYQVRKRRNRLLYTLKKDRNRIYIFNKKQFGYQVEKAGNTLTVYQNERPIYELERID